LRGNPKKDSHKVRSERGKRGTLVNPESKRRITINIMGEEYAIRGSSSPEHLQKVAEHVDSIMQQLSESNPHMSRHKIAVLASINLADELLRLKKDAGDEHEER